MVPYSEAEGYKAYWGGEYKLHAFLDLSTGQWMDANRQFKVTAASHLNEG